MTGGGGAEPRWTDLRTGPERRVRRAWREGPGPWLRAASVLYGVAAGLRGALWEAGVLSPARVPIPVISVGGLTLGGSGKTPLAAALARGLAPRSRVAIVTHGYPDEMDVHRTLNPGAVVRGAPDLCRAAAAAARAGAEVAVVDGGFQHRRLWRDADVVAVSVDAVRGAPRLRLPAGPYREGWAGLGRADAVVVTRRETGAGPAHRLADRLRSDLSGAVVTSAALRPGRIRPANAAARRAGSPERAVAVASIMYPEVFLRQLRRRGLELAARFVLPDHGRPGPARAARIAEAAGPRGVVGTLKDAAKLRAALAPSTPIWYLEDRLDWGPGRAALVDRLRELTARPHGREPTEG